MGLKAKIKFHDLTWPQEYRLVNEGGFHVVSRERGKWVILEKRNTSTNFDVLVNGQLPLTVQAELTKRCNNVANLYSDIYAFTPEIRKRLNLICQTLPKFQAEFIGEWMKENLDV